MYVSNTAGQEIRVFRRNDHDGSIDFVHVRRRLNSSVDTTFVVEITFVNLNELNLEPQSVSLKCEKVLGIEVLCV